MSVVPITAHGQVPLCAGDPFEAFDLAGADVAAEATRCRYRTKFMVIGSDEILGELAMVVVGACPVHVRAIERWTSQPFGAFTVDATPEALDLIVAGCKQDNEPIYVVQHQVA
jgi:hypothetical protein